MAVSRHRFAVLLAVLVVLLIAAGALVKSKEAGLAVPDWPLSYGSLNPPRWWQVENVRAEHGHRLFAGAVALLTLGLAVWTQRRERRRPVRRLAWAAVAAVLLQALLGGITVLTFLPPAVSIAHAALAELYLCLIVALAVVSSAAWAAGGRTPAPGRQSLRLPSTVLLLAVFAQILLGAVVRHMGAGLAIPDFPLVFGGIVPPSWSAAIVVHYAHRLGALATLGLTVWLAVRLTRQGRAERDLTRPALAIAGLVAAQILLGGAIVWTGRAVLPNTLHVATGATLLGAAMVLALETWREAFVPRLAGGEAEPAAGGTAMAAAPSR